MFRWRTAVFPWLIAIGVYGPYIVGGVRTEHVIVYLLAVISAYCLLGPASRWKIDAPLTTVWCLFCAIGIVSSAFPWSAYGLEGGQLAAGLDSLLLPLAVMLIVNSINSTPRDFLRAWSIAFIACTILNTFAALATASVGVEWTRFWSGGGAESTAFRAAQQGRYSGFVNQPAEAGYLYGVALLLASNLLARRPLALALTSGLLILGGLLTASKIFLLAALPIWILHAVLKLRGKRLFKMSSAAALLAGLTLYVTSIYSSLQVSDYLPVSQLNRLGIAVREDFWSGVTANRFGATSTLQSLFTEVWEGPRYFGFGAAGLTDPYDSAWLEASIYTGLFGVFCLGFALVRVGWLTLKIPIEHRSIAISLFLLTVAASIGFPVFTGNRTSTVFWITFLCFAILQDGKSRDLVDRGLARSNESVLSTSRVEAHYRA